MYRLKPADTLEIEFTRESSPCNRAPKVIPSEIENVGP